MCVFFYDVNDLWVLLRLFCWSSITFIHIIKQSELHSLTFDTKLHKKQLSAHQTQLKRRPGINAQRMKYDYKIKQPVAMETKL